MRTHRFSMCHLAICRLLPSLVFGTESFAVPPQQWISAHPLGSICELISSANRRSLAYHTRHHCAVHSTSEAQMLGLSGSLPGTALFPACHMISGLAVHCEVLEQRSSTCHLLSRFQFWAAEALPFLVARPICWFHRTRDPAPEWLLDRILAHPECPMSAPLSRSRASLI